MANLFERLFIGLFSALILLTLTACGKTESKSFVKTNPNAAKGKLAADAPDLLVGTNSGVDNGLHQFSSVKVLQGGLKQSFLLTNASQQEITDLAAAIEESLETSSVDFTFNGENKLFPGTGTCTDKLASNKTCTFVIQFAPQSAGDKTAKVNFMYKVAGQEKQMQFTLGGIGQLPEAEGELEVAAEGEATKFEVPYNSATITKNIILQNNSTRKIKNIQSLLTLRNGFQFVGEGFPGLTEGEDESKSCGVADLAAKDSCKISIVYKRVDSVPANEIQLSELILSYEMEGVTSAQRFALQLTGVKLTSAPMIEETQATVPPEAATVVPAESAAATPQSPATTAEGSESADGTAAENGDDVNSTVAQLAEALSTQSEDATALAEATERARVEGEKVTNAAKETTSVENTDTDDSAESEEAAATASGLPSKSDLQAILARDESTVLLNLIGKLGVNAANSSTAPNLVFSLVTPTVGGVGDEVVLRSQIEYVKAVDLDQNNTKVELDSMDSILNTALELKAASTIVSCKPPQVGINADVGSCKLELTIDKDSLKANELADFGNALGNKQIVLVFKLDNSLISAERPSDGSNIDIELSGVKAKEEGAQSEVLLPIKKNADGSFSLGETETTTIVQ